MCLDEVLLSAVVIHCQHSAAQIGLPSCPADKTEKRWYQRRLLGHIWGLGVLDQGQAPWPQILSQYELVEGLSWREKNHFLSLLFLTRFCTFSLNVDSILPHTEVASDFQSEPLGVFTVNSTISTYELVVVISFNSHNTTFASWHIFTCHNALQLLKNSHNTKFRVVAVSLMPQHVVVFFPLNESFRSLSLTCAHCYQSKNSIFIYNNNRVILKFPFNHLFSRQSYNLFPKFY